MNGTRGSYVHFTAVLKIHTYTSSHSVNHSPNTPAILQPVRALSSLPRHTYGLDSATNEMSTTSYSALCLDLLNHWARTVPHLSKCTTWSWAETSALSAGMESKVSFTCKQRLTFSSVILSSVSKHAFFLTWFSKILIKKDQQCPKSILRQQFCI